jgi:hypothetical protein
MALPDIDFDKIRPHDGSRNAGFEELCCQLASLEPRSPESVFFRKGRGGDAGVECFLRATDSKEIGWQAKYVGSWSDTLARELDKSIETALSKHPNLTKYVVCLPFDLPDARAGQRKTPLERWEAWQAKWVKAARAKKRDLQISLWNKSVLAEKLARDEPRYAGRLAYWFDQESFTEAWFRHQFEKSRKALGSRYTPETNVELPIRRDFLAFARDLGLNLDLHNWNLKLQEATHSAIRAVHEADKEKVTNHVENISGNLEQLTASFSCLPVAADQPVPVTDWRYAAKFLAEALSGALKWTYDLPRKREGSTGTSPAEWAQHSLFTASDALNDFIEDLESRRWHLANSSKLLLYGAAGNGKSHLLADVVEHQISTKSPALLILGSTFVDGDPWRQILTQLDVTATLQVKHFLAALDAAGQAAGTRALICIDAINERNGIDVWPPRLAAFLEEIEPFPFVAVALSCRSTYLQHILPDSVSAGDLPGIEHMGFAGRASEAAKVYLDKRGIVRPGAPNLVLEFENPLFLKTCCDYLEKEGKHELPRGLSGVTAIFGFYVDAIARALNVRMKLDPRLEIIPRAIRALASAFAAKGMGYIGKSEAIALFEAIHPSNGLLDRSLLAQLENEGAIAIEAVQQGDGSRSDEVRFTFERFSDHQIALGLLDQHLDVTDPPASFTAGTALHEIVCGAGSYAHAGVIEALSVQLPERTGVELIDVLPESDRDWSLRHPFMESLLWRDQAYFTNRTLEILRALATTDERLAILFSLATEPKNKFNARFLNKRLSSPSMPDRDRVWTAFINRQGNDDTSSVTTLITWSLCNGMETIEEDRAELAAIAITWLLTASNRMVRDRATKALACLFANRLALAGQILKQFEGVNDLYVLERLIAAIYGGVLQGTATAGLPQLAEIVYSTIFSTGSPPVNILLRDHALGILQYAAWRGELPNTVSMKVANPPYKSPWPIELVSDELIATYTQDYGKGEFRDAIVGSAVNDSDFARHTIDPLVRHWSQARRGSRRLPTYRELAKKWVTHFLDSANEEQLAALDALLEAARANGGTFSYQDTPEARQMNDAEQRLRKAMKPEAWEEYRVKAQNFNKYTLFKEDPWGREQTALFDASWARRWVCKRAHDLGWTAERFGEVDRYSHYGYSRHEHRLERIGKKYQWLAVYELAARMADNLAMLGDYSGGRNTTGKYKGPWQISLRNVDPSLLVLETHYDGWQQWPRTWWIPISPVLHEISLEERLAWRSSPHDIINDPALIDVTDPKTGRRWLVLDGFAAWRQSGIVDGHSELQRSTWFRLNCIVVRKSDRSKLLKWLCSRRLTSSDDLPETELHGEHYLGEYPWHTSLSDLPDSTEPGSWRAPPVPVRATVVTYSCERGSYDHSIEKTVKVALPAPWMIHSLGLRLSNGRRLTYASKEGRVGFFDPSVCEPGPQAALVNRADFLSMLKREDLVALWIIAGEKSAYSGRSSKMGWGGELAHTYVYELTDGQFVCYKRVEQTEPSAEQLRVFLGRDHADAPTGSSKGARQVFATRHQLRRTTEPGAGAG